MAVTPLKKLKKLAQPFRLVFWDGLGGGFLNFFDSVQKGVKLIIQYLQPLK